jgi:hypothetical protein
MPNMIFHPDILHVRDLLTHNIGKIHPGSPLNTPKTSTTL